jgi:hypothetical protein
MNQERKLMKVMKLCNMLSPSVSSLRRSNTVCPCFIIEGRVSHLQHDQLFASLPSICSIVITSALILTHYFLFSFIVLRSVFLFNQNCFLITFIFLHMLTWEYTSLCNKTVLVCPFIKVFIKLTFTPLLIEPVSVLEIQEFFKNT